jgi:tRNA (cmo5U34)-methyltransferase
MLRRSIPGYNTLLQLIGVYANETILDGDLIYDLGCSLGAVSLSIRHALGARNAHIIAVDNSSAMVERCNEIIQADGASCPVTVQLGDVETLDFKPCALVVMNFTLQFVPQAQRAALLLRIADQLTPGGALILSEKTLPIPGLQASFYEGIHDAFRRGNGYSQLEISRKREALETVLNPQSEFDHEQALRDAGLTPVPWFRCLQFASWVAKKDAAR